uniref:Uncharacterized protein n=1 Tax=Compsopogon caeruleus TaxID=31354 RepID=A0A6T6C2P0_9RHOD
MGFPEIEPSLADPRRNPMRRISHKLDQGKDHHTKQSVHGPHHPDLAWHPWIHDWLVDGPTIQRSTMLYPNRNRSGHPGPPPPSRRRLSSPRNPQNTDDSIDRTKLKHVLRFSSSWERSMSQPATPPGE